MVLEGLRRSQFISYFTFLFLFTSIYQQAPKMAYGLSKAHWTGWSAITLQGDMKESIVSELAKIILSNPKTHDQVFRTLISLSEVGCEDDRSNIDDCISDIWTDYQSKNILYLVDPRDKEVLHPEYKIRLPRVTRSEIHGGKTNRPRPEEIDLEVCARCEAAQSPHLTILTVWVVIGICY